MQNKAKQLTVLVSFFAFILSAMPAHSQYIHKCRSADGGVIYQSETCIASKDLTFIEWNKSNGSPATFTGQRITINFSQKSLDALLNIIAQVSGSELYVDRSKDFLVSAFYENKPWDEILHDLSDRYHLKVQFSDTKMIVEQQSMGAGANGNPPELTADDVIYDKLLASYEQRFPQINPDSPKFDAALVEKIHAEMVRYAKSNPKATPSDALSYAVLRIMNQ